MLIAWFAFLLIGTGCAEPIAIEGLNLVEVSPFSATLAWTTDSALAAHVVYGEGKLTDREVREKQATTRHSVTLTGLRPSTRYSYRIEPGGPTRSFRSAPSVEHAFDLVVLDAASKVCQSPSETLDVDPDLLVLLDDCANPWTKRPDSMLIRRMPTVGASELTLGPAIVILSRSRSDALKAIARISDNKRRILLVLPKLDDMQKEMDDSVIEISPRTIRYAGVETIWPEAPALRLEVDVYEVVWVRGNARERQRRLIIEAPPETKKTCLYCDRLLESGRYEDSLAWFRDFIDANHKMHVLEDAYFSIAQINDEKLFRYTDAIDGYREFLEYYPNSRRRVLARYRLDYLLAHADHEFEPLRMFERAKASLVQKDPLPTAVEVEALVKNFPDSSVAPEALFWLGHLLETVDPIRARNHYRTLVDRFPNSENSLGSAIALGDILYREKQYRQAITAYRKAKNIATKDYHVSIEEKIRKSRRNITREVAYVGSIVVLMFWFAVTFVLRALPAKSDWLVGAIVLAGYTILGGVYMAFTYEKSNALIPMLAILAVAMTLVLLWNRALGRKSNRFRGPLVLAHALTCSMAVLYLTLYAFHQVYVFGL